MVQQKGEQYDTAAAQHDLAAMHQPIQSAMAAEHQQHGFVDMGAFLEAAAVQRYGPGEAERRARLRRMLEAHRAKYHAASKRARSSTSPKQPLGSDMM